MTWTVVDVLLVLFVLLGALRGWREGFLLGTLGLARLVGGFLVGLRFYSPVAAWLGERFSLDDPWAAPVAFLLLFALTGLAVGLLGTLLLRRLPARAHGWRANRLLGLVPGALNGLVTAGVLAALALTLPLPTNLRANVRESLLANTLAGYAERVEAALRPVFADATRQTLNTLTPVRPESGERVSLPFRVQDAPPAPDLEREMLRLVNEERARAGLDPLAPDPELREVARRHSADMFARGYFAHVSPEGDTPFDRISEANIRYLTAGENLALASTLPLAHTGLMNSPGHRANILRPQFGRVGIGILDGGVRGLMVTQLFRN